MEHEGDDDTSCNRCTWNDFQRVMEELEIGGEDETIQTPALIRLARILRRILEICGDLLSLKLQWKTVSKHWCEKFARSNIVIIIRSNNDLEMGIHRPESKPLRYMHFLVAA